MSTPYYIYDSANPEATAALASAAINEAGFVSASRDRFSSIEGGISVRDGLHRGQWDYFRESEARPRCREDMLRFANDAYTYNGIIKFVVDMMADFVTQGIEVYHPSASKQKRYRFWWQKIQGDLVSERLVNQLYRNGTSIVKRNFADLNQGDIDDLESGVAYAAPSTDVDFNRTAKTRRNRIPLVYTFLNPIDVELAGGELGIFAGQPLYTLRLPANLIRSIKSPKNDVERALVESLPQYLKDAAASNKREVLLDPQKVTVLHYKKDDWQAWANPITLSILDDIVLYSAMKRADRAALEGSISKVRLWLLGDFANKMMPGPGAFQRLKEQLLANVGGGSMDIIWDASLNLKESSTDVSAFLGSEKYQPVLQAIYAGLGIPQSMTGGSGKEGMTNNALSLKTLIERLTYARNILVDFWEREFYLLQRAFGDRYPARLKFSSMSLSDEATEKMLWFHLYDRHLISAETIRERFEEISEIEERRIAREEKSRDEGGMPAKVGPFIDAAGHPDQLAKVALTQGTAAPSEVGVKKKPKKDKSVLDVQEEQAAHDRKLAERQQKVAEKQGADLHQQKLKHNEDAHKQKLKIRQQQATSPANKGTPGQGRPKGKKDATQRKQRTPKAISHAVTARRNQRAIARVHDRRFLARAGKEKVSQLTAAELSALEDERFALLLSLPPGVPVNADELPLDIPSPSEKAREELARILDEVYGGVVNAEEAREARVMAYLGVNEVSNEYL